MSCLLMHCFLGSTSKGKVLEYFPTPSHSTQGANNTGRFLLTQQVTHSVLSFISSFCPFPVFCKFSEEKEKAGRAAFSWARRACRVTGSICPGDSGGWYTALFHIWRVCVLQPLLDGEVHLDLLGWGWGAVVEAWVLFWESNYFLLEGYLQLTMALRI